MITVWWLLLENHFQIRHIENVFQRAQRSSMLGCPMGDNSFVRIFSVVFPSLISLHGIIIHLMSWNNVITKLAQPILPLRYYNMKSPIKSIMFSLAYFHSLDIFHLLSINPNTMLKGQLEQWVTEHSKDSLHFLSFWFLSLSLTSSSSSRFIKQAMCP